jgi:hypothetical protein
MAPGSRKIRVHKPLSDDLTQLIRVRKGRVCSSCGCRKPTVRFRGKFVCTDCQQSILDNKQEAKLTWKP